MERTVPVALLRAIQSDLTRALDSLAALMEAEAPPPAEAPHPLPPPLSQPWSAEPTGASGPPGHQPTPLGVAEDAAEEYTIFHAALLAAVAAQLPTIPPPSPADSAALFDAIPFNLAQDPAISVILGALAKIEAEADVKTTPWRLLGGWLRKIGWEQLAAEIAAWQARQQQSPLGREGARRREAAALAAAKPPPRPPTALPALAEIEALRRRLAASRDEVLGGAT